MTSFVWCVILTISIIGGDVRQAYLAKELERKGYEVLVWGICKGQTLHCCSLEEALKSDLLILPLPSSQDGVTLNAPNADETVRLDALAARISPHQLVLCAKLSLPGVRCIDYYKREELTLLNAIPTAEGAIEIAMHESKRTLWGASSLIVGYGRIGKLLCDRLSGFQSRITASARKPADFALIRAAGFECLQTASLQKHIANYDFVFNTVPHLVIDRQVLARLRRGAVVIDLASAPGGVDFAAAKELGVNAIHALSLPAKYAPETAAEVLGDTIENIISEQLK